MFCTCLWFPFSLRDVHFNMFVFRKIRLVFLTEAGCQFCFWSQSLLIYSIPLQKKIEFTPLLPLVFWCFFLGNTSHTLSYFYFNFMIGLNLHKSLFPFCIELAQHCIHMSIFSWFVSQKTVLPLNKKMASLDKLVMSLQYHMYAFYSVHKHLCIPTSTDLHLFTSQLFVFVA